MEVVLKILFSTLLVATTVTAKEAAGNDTKIAKDVLKCYGCEMSNFTTKSCNFSYACQTNDFCETIVSRVDGRELNVILSCASEEKCLAEKTNKSLGDCDISKLESSVYK